MGRTAQEQGQGTSRADAKALPKPKPITRPLMKIAIPAKATPAKGTPSELAHPPEPPPALAEGTDVGIDNRATVEMSPLEIPHPDDDLDPPCLDDDELAASSQWEAVEPDPDAVEEALHMDDLEPEPAEPQQHWDDAESEWGASTMSDQQLSQADITNPGVDADDELTTADQLVYDHPDGSDDGDAAIHSKPQTSTLLFGMEPLVPPRPQAIPLTVPPSADAEQRITTMPITQPWHTTLWSAIRMRFARVQSWFRRRRQPKLLTGTPTMKR
ncbi:MAG: hypothetical protein AB7O24_15310 [Kofleriaceae bacterium]